ncbi:unnamed protein product [Lupinus luteus]|uniref:Uncharacterized protein n=1 Tax=Lupinus luteus TaxID=3873 RepID=A0AAV1VR74_LUPLU
MNNNQNQQLNPFDPTSHDDFLNQMLSNLDSASSWLDPNNNINKKPMLWDNKHDETTLSNVENNVVGFAYDEHAGLASKFRNHHITTTSSTNKEAAAAALLLHDQLLMARGVTRDSGILQMPLSLGGNDVVDESSFKSHNLSAENSLKAMHNGFARSLHGTVQASNQTQHFQPPQGATNNQATSASGAIQNPDMKNNQNQQLNPFDPTSHDDFLNQMLSNLDSASSWLDPNNNINKKLMLWDNKHDETTLSNVENNVVGFAYDEHAGLASKFRNHHITTTSPTNKVAAAAALLLHDQLLMARGVTRDSGILQMPLSLGGNDVVDESSFKSHNLSAENSLKAMHNGFARSLHGTVQASN